MAFDMKGDRSAASRRNTGIRPLRAGTSAEKSTIS
jgi:hypothetical protein